jgi:hypothetical protein
VIDAAIGLAFEEASLRHAELVAVHTWLEHTSDAAYVAAVEAALDWDALSNAAGSCSSAGRRPSGHPVAGVDTLLCSPV